MKKQSKMKTLFIGATLAVAFSAAGAYKWTADYGVMPQTMITADAASDPYSGTAVMPTKITSENLASFGLADNTYLGYYAITTAEELMGFSDFIDLGSRGDLSACAVLLNDIIFNDGTVTVDGSSTGTTHKWDPIGDWGYEWNGTFDGNGHSISGLYTKWGGYNYVGLFGYISGGTVKNVILKNSYFEASLYMGGIVGIVRDGATITNCRVESSVTMVGKSNSSADWIGGIAGSSKGITISNCYVEASISGDRITGAITGESVDDTLVNNYYKQGCTTAKGQPQNAVGRNSSIGEPLADVAGENTSLASSSANHTHVAGSRAGNPGVSDAYTYCVVCLEVLDVAHEYRYEKTSFQSTEYNEFTVTETCANCAHQETLEVRVKDPAMLVYTGATVEAYQLVYSDGWGGPRKTDADIVYLENDAYSCTKAGNAQAYIKLGIIESGAPTENMNSTEYLLYRIEKGRASLSVAMSDYRWDEQTDPAVTPIDYAPGNELTYTYQYKKQGASDSEYTLTKPAGVGDYTVSVTATTANYNDATATADFSILKSANGDLQIDVQGWIYGETAYTPSASSSTNETSTAVYEYKAAGALDSAYTTVQPTDAGQYTLRVSLDATADYEAVQATKDFTIDKKSVRFTFADNAVTYDANLKQVTITPTAGTMGLDYQVTYYQINENEGTVGGQVSRTVAMGCYLAVIEVLNSNYTMDGAVYSYSYGGAMPDETAFVNIVYLKIAATDADTLERIIDEKAAVLELALNEKAGAVELSAAISDLTAAIELAKQSATAENDTLKVELENAIAAAQDSLQTAIDTVQANLDGAMDALRQTIADEDGKLDDRITQEAEALRDAIELAQQVAQSANDTLKTGLENAIAMAQDSLQTAIDTVQANLDGAVDALRQTIADQEGKLDDRITDEVAEINEAIELAKKVASLANEELKTSILNKVSTAENALQKAIDAVRADMDAAVKELNEVIAAGDKALLEEFADELAAAIQTLNAAIETAKGVASANDAGLESELTAAIAAANEALAGELKALIEANTAAIQAVKSDAKQDNVLPIVLGGVAILGNLILAAVVILGKKKNG